MTDRERMLAAYKAMNALWPADMAKPSGPEALAAARALVAEGFRYHGKPVPALTYALTSGNRHTWVRRGVMSVNPDRRGGGWRELVHGISHWVHARVYPNRGGHDAHLPTERLLTEFAIAQGFAAGSLKREPKAAKPKPDVQQVRAAQVEAAIARWESKAKRAANALRKLKAKRAYYARALAAPKPEPKPRKARVAATWAAVEAHPRVRWVDPSEDGRRLVTLDAGWHVGDHGTHVEGCASPAAALRLANSASPCDCGRCVEMAEDDAAEEAAAT